MQAICQNCGYNDDQDVFQDKRCPRCNAEESNAEESTETQNVETQEAAPVPAGVIVPPAMPKTETQNYAVTPTEADVKAKAEEALQATAQQLAAVNDAPSK